MAEPVRLENIDAFRTALREYHMSPHAEGVLRDARLVVLSGIAGGGRNTVINYLVEHNNYFFLVSDTTRPPKLRDGVMEQTGVQYHFRKEADMLRDIQQGEFVEAEIIHNQQVSGTSVRELERANASGRIIIHEIEFGGIANVAAAKPDTVVIGLLPPSYEEWIRRLQSREDMHEEEFINRLRTAEKVLESMLGEPYFKFVVNNNVADCAEAVRSIVERSQVDRDDQDAAKRVASDILAQVRTRLRS
jgi:guanylate kinase